MTEGAYRTVAAPGAAAFRIRGSRFIGRIEHASNVAAAESCIATLESDHPDATHVVPAYRVRTDPLREYQRDAGEPAGSAGPPMLSVLRGNELENVVAVVVRYYGGTDLGVGGLVRSYGNAVKQALAETEIVTQRPQVSLMIETSYDDSGTVRSILEASDATFDATYQERVHFGVDVPVDVNEELHDRIMSATSGRAAIQTDY